VLWSGAFPGTSCQATIGLSLRDRTCCLAASESPTSSPFDLWFSVGAIPNPSILAKACCEMSRRDGVIVAWHEVPGKGPFRKGRPVGYGVTVFRYFAGSGKSWGDAEQVHSVHESRTTSGTSCVRSYRTLRDGALEVWRGAVPGTSCQATVGLSLRDRTCCLAASGSLDDRFERSSPMAIEMLAEEIKGIRIPENRRRVFIPMGGLFRCRAAAT
jgi:hypothetical protein